MLILISNIWFWHLLNYWWNHIIPICIHLLKSSVVQLWLLLWLIILKDHLLRIFLYVLLRLFLLVLLHYHPWLHLYWIILDLMLHLLGLLHHLCWWVTGSQLPIRGTSLSALAGSLT
jgi:hypothetical protein